MDIVATNVVTLDQARHARRERLNQRSLVAAQRLDILERIAAEIEKAVSPFAAELTMGATVFIKVVSSKSDVEDVGIVISHDGVRSGGPGPLDDDIPF
jgi:hypothetical protein